MDEAPVDWEMAAQRLFDKFAFPNEQPDCLSCKLLPCCHGGCPEVRLRTGKRDCPELLADPDAFVLSKL